MGGIGDPIVAAALRSERLALEPLRVEHSAEMAALLDDPRLYYFIGGEPASPEQLRDRYERQVLGHSADGTETWLNWILRRLDNGQPVGTVQATITAKSGDGDGGGDSGGDSGGDGERAGSVADIAWVIGRSQQGQGYAREAALAMVGWLWERHVTVLTAYVHPQHEASMAVARAVGLEPTEGVVDGEVRWEAVRTSGLPFPDEHLIELSQTTGPDTPHW